MRIEERDGMDKPQIFADVTPPPESGEEYAKVVLRGMAFDLESPKMKMEQAQAIAAELNDRTEAGDLHKLIEAGHADSMRDQVFLRAVRYAKGKAAGRRRADVGPLSTLAALMAGLGDLAVTVSEADMNEHHDPLESGFFEQACRGTSVIILETIILLSTWGIDARVVIRTFLDAMEGRDVDDEARVGYLQLVDNKESN